MEEMIIRSDLYIEGFEPVKGVPIELTGCRSYELTPLDDHPLLGAKVDSKGNKHTPTEISIIVNVRTEGN